MSTERTTYRERTPWPGFASAILWGVVIPICYAVLSGATSDLPMPTRIGVVAAILVGAYGLAHVFGGLTVHVQETRIFVHLGSVPLVRTSIALADVVDLESVTYRPIAEFGGWGLRRSRSGRTAWTARGSRAVKLALGDGREVLIGSDHPRRLEERIRTAARSLARRHDDLAGDAP